MWRAADFFLDRRNLFRSFLSETLEVEVLDVLPERHLPRLLIVVVQLAELFGIHPELAGHLNMGMR